MKERLKEALRETAAEFLSREANRQSLITVTETYLSDDSKRAQIFITVLPDSQEQAALDFCQRSRGEFAEYFSKRVKAHVPHVEFVIDKGEKMRQRLDELTS